MSRRDWHADAERLSDDLATYALGALDQPEAADLETHLGTCSDCRQRVLWLRPAVDMLPASVAQLSPPESLRENLLATVRAEAARRADADAGSVFALARACARSGCVPRSGSRP